MVIKKPDDVKSSEITPKRVYLDRRTFMRGAALVGSVAATGFLYRELPRAAACPADEPSAAA